MNDKVALFLCRCKDNIAGRVDMDALAERFRGDEEIALVAEHELLCAPEGKAFLTETMTAAGVTRAVVAACSPKEHEGDFREALERAGVNRYLLQMANIREHCAWVTEDRGAAYQKATAMIRGAIRRVRLHERLEAREVDCRPELLVVGGGIAGIEAALVAAEAGRTVFLVESGPSLGGRLAELEAWAPTMECTPCALAPRLAAVGDSDRVALFTNSTVEDVLGYLGHFQVKVRKRARWVDESLCIACETCREDCPVSVPNEIQRGLGDRKAIYVPFPGAMPSAAIIDRERCLRSKGEACAACAEVCPMGAVDFSQPDESIELGAGAVILATGAGVYEPGPGNPFGFGEHPDVYTLSQLERLASHHGPTGGKIVKADGSRPGRIAVVHCVGRRELGYCSGVCCQAALKVGLLVDGGPDEGKPPEVVHFHTDLMCAGPLGSALLNRAKARGTKLVRMTDPEALSVFATDTGFDITFRVSKHKAARARADMIVLVTGMTASSGTRPLVEKLELTTDDAGFVAPDHPLLRPEESSVGGVFLAGCVAGPRGIADSVRHARAAAGTALARVQPGKKLTLEVLAPELADERCSRCLVCVSVCPFRACRYDEPSDRVEIAPALCRGCGTCAAACPSGAARARHFTDEQIDAEIEEVLG